MANRLIYSAGEIYLKSNSYLKSYYKYHLIFDNAHSLGKLNALINNQLTVSDPFSTSELYNIGINLNSKHLIKNGDF